MICAEQGEAVVVAAREVKEEQREEKIPSMSSGSSDCRQSEKDLPPDS